MSRAAGLSLLLLAIAAVAAFVLWPRDEERPAVTEDPAVAARRAEELAEERRQAAERRRAASMATVTGEVRRAGDRGAAADLVVTLTGPSGPPVETRTDARGAFEFRAMHGGPYAVGVVSPGSAEVRVPGLQLVRGETRDVGTLWLAPAVVVDVEVRTFAGEPIGGARVEVFRADGAATWSPVPLVPVRTLSTSADGVAHLADLAIGTYTFVASKTGFARRGSYSMSLAAGDAPQRVRLALERGCRITGRVLERDGTGVASATILSLPRTLTADGNTAPLCGRAVSGADGRYVLESLPQSDVCLWVARSGGQLGLVAAVRPPGVPELDLVLPAPAFVEGRITDAAASAPLAGAVIDAQFEILGGVSMSFQAAAGDDGAYRLELPMDGTLSDVRASAAGFLKSDDALFDGGRDVRGGALVRLDFALRRGASLSGRVTSGGEPVSRAEVHASLSGADQYATTDRDGAYRFDAVPAGTITVSASRAGFRETEARSIDVLDGAAGATVDLELAPGDAGHKLRGTVTGATGEPVAGASVRVGGGADSATTAADGTFEIAGCPSGAAFLIHVRKEGYSDFETEISGVDTDVDTPIEISLTPHRRISGRVRSSLGAALVDAFVQVAGSGERTPVDDEWIWLGERRWPVRADGTFEIDVIAESRDVILRALARDHAPGLSDVILWQGFGELDRDVEITLPPANRLSGIVRTTDDVPLASAWVAIYPRADESDGADECNGAWGPAVVAVTDAAGRFAVDGLGAGIWGVNAWGTGTLKGRAIATVPSAGDVVVEVERALTIEGTVSLPGGAPAAGIVVSACTDDGAEFTASCDERGAFRFEGLGRGTSTLTVMPQGHEVLAARVEGVAAGSRGVRIELQKGMGLAGVVVFRDGTPVANAHVSARDPASGENVEAEEVRTNESGGFEIFGLPPGEVDVHVAIRTRDDQRSGTTRGFTAGERSARVVVPALAEFRGVLVDETLRALSGMSLTAVPAGGPTAFDESSVEVRTAEDGSFSFKGSEDARFVLQLTDAEGVGLFEDAVIAPSKEPVRIVARAGASIAGVVTADGEPVAGATVSATGSNHVRRATTDEHGAFEVRGLMASAPYELSVAGAGLAESVPSVVEAGVRGLKILGRRGYAIAGRVEDESGRPIQSARLALRREGNEEENLWLMTDDDGRFAADGLVAGEWSVFVWGRSGTMHPCGKIRAGEMEATLRMGK